MQYGPPAARDAATAGAHREAVAHYRLVLGHRERFAPAELAELLEGYAVECYTIGTAEAMLAAQGQAIKLRRSLGDQCALGADLRWLSRMAWWAGDRTAAEQAAAEAITVLEPAGDRRLLALALSNQSQLHGPATTSLQHPGGWRPRRVDDGHSAGHSTWRYSAPQERTGRTTHLT